MTRFYVLMIKTEKMKLEEVPAFWRKNVEVALENERGEES